MKSVCENRVVSGHDFSRAVKVQKELGFSRCRYQGSALAVPSDADNNRPSGPAHFSAPSPLKVEVGFIFAVVGGHDFILAVNRKNSGALKCAGAEARSIAGLNSTAKAKP